MTEIILHCKTRDSKYSSGKVKLQELSSSERLKIAGRALGIFWGLALISVFIPVLHFFLVPAFLGIGAFWGYRSYKAKNRIVASELLCAACLKPLNLLGKSDLWPLSENCPHCQELVRIEP